MCTHRYFCWVACVCKFKVKKCWKVSRVCVGQELPVGCTIVGDPQHDIINLSKVLHFRTADKEDLQKDHIDMIHRLSAADSPVSASKEVVPEAALSDAGLALLRSACIDTSPAWREQFESSADAAKEVKGFLALPRVLQGVEVNFWGGSHPEGHLEGSLEDSTLLCIPHPSHMAGAHRKLSCERPGA